MDELALAAKHRSCTGVLASHPDARDVHINNLSILFHGAELLMESNLELNSGNRYGLIGLNGCGNFFFCQIDFKYYLLLLIPLSCIHLKLTLI